MKSIYNCLFFDLMCREYHIEYWTKSAHNFHLAEQTQVVTQQKVEVQLAGLVTKDWCI
jgi:hypothetical protein